MLKAYPEIIFKASNNNKPVNAFRLWFIAKGYDNGNSNIPAKKFRRYLKRLGIQRATYYRWIGQALDLGLISHQTTTQGLKVYSLASWERGAMIAGVTTLLKPVKIPIEKFINKGWLSWAWAGFVKHFENKPMSRATLERLTGVPKRTQRGYEKQAEVKSKAHFANLGDPTVDPQRAAMIDERRGVYGKAGMTRKRLPNSRTVENIELGNKGRTKKINGTLKALLLTRRSSQQSEKLYFETYQALKRATRGKQRDGNAKDRPAYRYLYLTDLLGLGVWEGLHA